MEKALSTAEWPLSPGAAVRRVLECVASGTLLEGQFLSPGRPRTLGHVAETAGHSWGQKEPPTNTGKQRSSQTGGGTQTRACIPQRASAECAHLQTRAKGLVDGAGEGALPVAPLGVALVGIFPKEITRHSENGLCPMLPTVWLTVAGGKRSIPCIRDMSDTKMGFSSYFSDTG